MCAKPLESCPAPCDSTRLLCPGASPGENTGDDGRIFPSRVPGVALGQDSSGLGGAGCVGDPGGGLGGVQELAGGAEGGSP